MSISLNHTIVHARDALKSATFLAGILGRPAPVRFLHFQCVQLDNGVTLDFIETDDVVLREHYAFLVSEPEFDQILRRIEQRDLPYWADPAHRERGINRHDGGRGLYWDDPDGHVLEIITRPYGSGG